MRNSSIQKILIRNRIRIFSGVSITIAVLTAYPLIIWRKSQFDFNFWASMLLFPIASWVSNIWLRVNAIEGQLEECNQQLDEMQKTGLKLNTKVEYLISYSELNKRVSKLENTFPPDGKKLQ